ncbi:hypothetical protein GGI17_005772, partial [Coemansia sp. S146]
CHYVIVKKCKILHRDISDNNILVVRMEDGTVRGLLIDFDCAIDISRDKKEVRGEMTGTRPFMSLNNLMRSNIKRTSLDDWESMLYLLCWYATIGFGTGEDPPEAQELTKAQKLAKAQERAKEQERLEQLPIARWRNGIIVTVTREKLTNFRSLDNFRRDIVREFSKKGANNKELQELALDLYKALFANNKRKKKYHGTEGEEDDPFVVAFVNHQQRPTSVDDDSSNTTNPFALRAEKWEQISKDLLSVIEKAKKDMVNWKENC